MAGMGVKFCAASDCSRGGSRPVLIWSNVDDFDIIKKCAVCGEDLLEKVPPTVSTVAGVKRGFGGIGIDVETEKIVPKRPRAMPTPIPTGPRTTVSMLLRDNPAVLGDDLSTRVSVTPGLGKTTISRASRVLDIPPNPITRFGESQVNTERQVQSPLEIHQLKWCLGCNWSGHNTSECKGSSYTSKEPLVADTHWERFDRKLDLSAQYEKPRDVLELMDYLQVHQSIMGAVEGRNFFAERDTVLRALLQDQSYLDTLDPILRAGETSKSIYEAQIIKANNATKSFLVAVVQAIFVVFRDTVVGQRRRLGRENASQFRMRLTEEVKDYPARFPLNDQALQALRPPSNLLVQNILPEWSPWS